jgi:hypothetical protein
LRFEVKRNRLAVVLDPKEAGVTDGARTHDNRNHNRLYRIMQNNSEQTKTMQSGDY